jgi:ATP-dependent helicase HrpA
VEPISQAAANQRAGRCGRVADGICIRLYDEKDFRAAAALHRPGDPAQFAGRRDPAHEVAAPGHVEDFPFLEPPPRKAIADGYQLLAELGAVDDATS